MLTKACKQAIQTFPVWTTTNNTNNAKPMFPTSSIKNTSNQERWVSFVNGNLLSTLNINVNNGTNAGFHFGTGTTAPTENDYKLQTDITTNFAASMNNYYRGIDANNKPYMKFIFAVTNTSSSSSLSISEIGLITQNIYVCTSSSATSATANTILIDRTLLDNVLVVSPLQTAAIEYTITCDMSFS